MSQAKAPRSLRMIVAIRSTDQQFEIKPSYKMAAACLVAVGSITGAEAQQSNLPAVTVDAPVARPRLAVARPSAEQLRVRAALRAARRAQTAPAPALPSNISGSQAADRNPYADPNAPYKADRVSSVKFTEPLLNTPKTVTVLTKELLADKNATTLKEVARTTAGVTLGTGEGGNAFGDRFFIRGFDARNDVFVDGIRDPAISIRENFFTEQVEILRGPASSYAGRGTAGGALNIVTKQAGDRNLTNAETTFGTDNTKRVTVDVNQVISPTLSVRFNGMGQKANVAGRDFVFDDRWGGLAAVKWTPTNTVKVTANYIHTDLNGLPDFGVPYNRAAGAPSTDINVPRNTYYGFVNRDFQKAKQDFATVNAEILVNDNVTLNNRARAARSILNYVGTLPSNPTATTVNLASQSRYQITDVLGNQADATIKFDLGPVRHTAVVGTEFSRESVKRDTYAGLTAELSGIQVGNSVVVPLLNPPNEFPFANAPGLAGNPAFVKVDTKSVYLIDTANYQDFLILNGGVRLDDYNVEGSSRSGGQTGVNSTMLNYNGGIVIKPLPNASIYAAYATSSNPVGAELDASGTAYGGLNINPTVFQALDPERNKAKEVGTKWELFDRRLLATAALFETVKENAREQVGNTIVSNASYRVRGIDLGVSGKITDKWSVFGGLVLMETKVLQSVNAPEVGAQLANIAHQSFNVLSKYKVTDAWELGGQATYVSKIFGGTFGAINGNVLPDHWRFDAFTEYKINKNLTAKIFVNNIFDTVYYDAFYRSNSPFVFIAPGRSAALSMAAKF